MKPLLSLIAALALVGPAWAQGGEPPADPADPNAKPEPLPPACHEYKTWMAAREAARKKDGYAVLFVTEDKIKGWDSPYARRLTNMYFGNPYFYNAFNETFTLWMADLNTVRTSPASKHLSEAGVDSAPAFIFVEPSDGTVVDWIKGKPQYLEFDQIVKQISKGRHLRGCEKLLKDDKDAKNDPDVNLDYAKALVRTGSYKDALPHLKDAKESKTMRTALEAQLLEMWVDYHEGDSKKALDKAQELFEKIPQMAREPRAECLYVQVWIYHKQNKPEEAAKIAQQLTTEYIRTPHGWKLLDDMQDLGYDFMKMEKIEKSEPTEEYKEPEPPKEEPPKEGEPK